MQTKYTASNYPSQLNLPAIRQSYKLWDYLAFIFSIAFSFSVARSLVYQMFNPWILMFFTFCYMGLIVS